MLWADLGQAWRRLKRKPKTPVLWIFVVSVGVAFFSVAVSACEVVLWRPLPFDHASQLVAIEIFSSHGNQRQREMGTDTLARWAEQQDVLQSIAAYQVGNAWVSDIAIPVLLRVARVSPDLFNVLRVRPRMGRSISRDDNDVAIISESFSKSCFGIDRTAIGRRIRIDGQPYTVIGIADDDFTFPAGGTKVWIPLHAYGHNTSSVRAVGRLRDGVTLSQASARLATRAGGAKETIALEALILRDRQATATLYALLTAGILVLLISVGNASNLMLGEMQGRRAELSVRLCVGASRVNIASCMVAEVLLRSVAAAVIGIGVGAWLVPATRVILPLIISFQIYRPIAMDWVAFIAAVGAAACASAAASALMIWWTGGLNGSIPNGGSTPVGRVKNRARTILLMAEFGVAIALMIGGGLLVNSFLRLTNVDEGYDPDHLLMVSIYLPPSDFGSSMRARVFLDDVRDHVSTMPGVTDVTISNGIPPFAGVTVAHLQALDGDASSRGVIVNMVENADQGYFGTLGIPLARGRAFRDEDRTRAADVVIISESLAHKLKPSGDPVGMEFKLSPDASWLTVVGIARDVRYGSFQDGFGTLAVYRPVNAASRLPSSETIAIRTTGEPSSAAPAVMRIVRHLDRGVPILDAEVGRDFIARTRRDARSTTVVFSALGLLGFVLSVLGAYGMWWEAVRQRTHEIGVRSALGCTRTGVVRLFAIETLKTIAVASVLGTWAATGVSRLLRGMLFQVSPIDPMTYLLVVAVVTAASLFATVLAVRSVTEVDAMAALRHQ